MSPATPLKPDNEVCMVCLFIALKNDLLQARQGCNRNTLNDWRMKNPLLGKRLIEILGWCVLLNVYDGCGLGACHRVSYIEFCLWNHHGKLDKATLSTHPIGGAPEGHPIRTSHIDLHTFFVCHGLWSDYRSVQWLFALPPPLCLFFVWIRHPSVEIKWIEWIFWEREREWCHPNIWWHFCFWFCPVCFWDHLTFIRLPKVSTVFWPIEMHVLESLIIENLCFSCTWPSAGALGMGEAITWLHTNSCEWGLLVWAVWSRLQLSTCELIHVLLMGQSGPGSSTAVTVWVCVCFFISLWPVAITLLVVCIYVHVFNQECNSRISSAYCKYHSVAP